MDLGLADATAVVAGGSKGMGRAVAQSLAGEGARIAVLARTQGALDETVDSLRSLGARDAVGLATDLTSWESVERALETLGERWESLNILVNAAGPVDVGIGLFEDVDDDEWQATFDIGTVERGTVCTSRTPSPALGIMGPHREHLGPFDQTPVSEHRGVHRGQGRPHQPEQEPLRLSGGRRDLGEHGLARLLPVGGSEGLLTWSPCGAPR